MEIWFKQRSRPRMNHEVIGKNFLEKKSDPENRKKSTKQGEIAAFEQKTTNKRAKFCSNTVFLLYCKKSGQTI